MNLAFIMLCGTVWLLVRRIRNQLVTLRINYSPFKTLVQRKSSLRELRDTPGLYLFQPGNQLLPDILLQALAFCIADPIGHPVFLDLTTRQQLSVALLAGHQTMQDRATPLLCSSCHHGSNRPMHDLGESSCVPAQASRAETRGDHVHNHTCTLYRAQGCKLANGTLFYELCESVPNSIIC